MAFSIQRYITDVARYGVPRGTVQALNALLAYNVSQVKDQAGCTRGTTAAKAKTANTIHYTINGAFATALTAQDDFWTLAGTVVAAASWQKYALLVDATGTASIQEATQSTVSAAAVTWTNVSAVSPWAPFLDTIGSTKCVVGVLTVATDATHTFTPGTTALNAAGITATFIDGVDQSLLPLLANAAGTTYGDT